MKKVAFHNLGCKVNSYEMDGMEQYFQNSGYEIVDFAQKADIFVINTCSVTNIADRKSRQMIHKAKSINPDAVVVAVGCYVQADEKRSREDESIDIAIGNNLKCDIVRIVEEYMINRNIAKNQSEDDVETVFVKDLKNPCDYEDFILEDSNEHTRAFIKIQDGCNQFCSYCIIPYTRGRIRSRSKDSIKEEITLLTKKGYREFVLTGIHLSSYGIEEGSYNSHAARGFNNEKLLEIIEMVADIKGVDRIRLGSLEPRLITDEFLSRLSKIGSVCPHFHLSLQSGCDSVLKRMNRHYSTLEYMEGVKLLRKYYDHPAINTDVIVGFPEETEEEFERSRQYLNEIDFYETHIFKYSRRRGTVADRMKGQLTEKEKTARSNILIMDSDIRKSHFMEYHIGKKMDILLEEVKKIGEKSYFVGYSEEYVRCAVEICEDMGNIYSVGQYKNIVIRENELIHVRGERVLDDYLICKVDK